MADTRENLIIAGPNSADLRGRGREVVVGKDEREKDRNGIASHDHAKRAGAVDE